MASISSGNIIDVSDILALCYPVGSIYMSVSSTSPASFIGGTWTKLTDRFLVGAGSSYSVNSTGGANTVTLSVSQIPDHQHWWYSDQYLTTLNYDSSSGRYVYITASSPGTCAGVVGTTGGAHENRPPYLAVYMWKRTA